jgi:hypothetical protein
MGITVLQNPPVVPLLTSSTPADVVTTAGAVGAANQAARGDHTHKLIDTGWIAPTLVNGWINYGGGFAPCGYRKIGNMVYLRGLLKNGTANLMFTLPAGYRPEGLSLFGIEGGGAHGRIDVDVNGAVSRVSGGNAYIQIDISFVADL